MWGRPERAGVAVRALVVAHDVPWPSLGGGLVRLAQVIRALGSVTDLDLFVLHDQRRSSVVVPPTVKVVRATGVPFPRTSPQLRWRLEWAVRRGVPLEVVRTGADAAPRLALRDWARPRYDLVWFSTAGSYEWTGRPDLGPAVVDLMDLQDVMARRRADLPADQHPGGPKNAVQARLARYQARLNGRDWARFQRSLAARVERIVVPSTLDADRSGLPNVTVIPNSYPRPSRPAGDPAAGGPPVVLFQGRFEYPPNMDGAQWLATAIAPRVRAAVPQAEVRLVGRPVASVTQLHEQGVLTVVGQVRAMEEELARASVAVVPLRFGGGTRVKILESFAHRVPVVSTTLGAEGLEVEDGVHLLLADDPAEFAAATVRVLEDARLRIRLADAAEARFLDRYDGRVADEGVGRLVEEFAGLSTRS
jgi:glycosyltransferase involved in cell wall biosynthesis